MKTLLLLFTLLLTSYLHASDKPNILFIYTDDQAPWALGESGNKQALTPNMDKLAREGVYYPNAYTTTPVCSPSRAGLLTSKYGYETGIDDWINTKYKSLTEQEPELGLDANLPNWVRDLQNHGYHTGLVGKWHLGYQAGHHPSHYGYDEFHGFIAGGTKPINPTIETGGKLVQTKGFTADVLTDFAIDFINRHQTQPFMLSLHYRAPHTNWLPVAKDDMLPIKAKDIELPHPDYPNLNSKRAKRMMREYLSSLRSVDRNLGVLLSKLDELKLSDNTVVIFTSDHGYNLGHNGIWHKGNGHWLLKTPTAATPNIPKNQRPNMYDTSIKVPLFIKWPQVGAQGKQSLSTFSNLDWYPTILSIAGIKPKKELRFRGVDQSSTISAPERIISDDYYAAYTTKHQSKSGMRMYSDGRYKLVKDFINTDRDEFYDLSRDPAETTNIINTNNALELSIIKSFNEKITAKMAATNDPLLK
ncbi:sulfatase-like hydrolase/transferase [Paraferrimonas sp. SM1919]|uniref:sulfatase-like hydrolase/transferase n=1 Tax=Paraferrimonas sp. SM1919 TaxID=2662263 RepID=UPI0013D81C30|nr:sulfatase-like hydrolase/transferase [Paraferrimonas sp. SM1919]